MSTDVVCRRCGATLASDGLCPRCEFALALAGPGLSTDLVLETAEPLKRFGEYELLEQIGHGGMGVVYRARQAKLKRVVALKLLLLGQFSSQQSVQRFQREAQAAAALKHPNIVSIYDIGEVEGQPYLTMEYIEGRDLAALLKAGPLPAREAAGYCRAVAEAIGTAHAAGIVHRDLKPSNILIDIFGQPRITDFGLAKWFGQAPALGESDESDPPPELDLTISGQMLGSPNYLAPELAAGQLRAAGPASDIYAIGALLYECITGRPPFFAATLQETLLRIHETEPISPRALNPGVPRDLETICLKCLEKEPARRYPSAQELGEDLARFLAGEPVRARPVGPGAKAWRWCRRKPVVASLSTALIMALVLGLTGVLWQWRRAVAGELDARQRQYASDMNQVQQAWEEGNVRRARELLAFHVPKPGAPELRGFEWRYLANLCQDESRYARTNFEDEVVTIASDPGGKSVAVAVGAAIKFVDATLHTELGELCGPDDQESSRQLAFAIANTNVLVTLGDQGTVRVWNLATREGRPFLEHLTGITAVAVSPDGTRLAVASGSVLTLWSVAPQRVLWSQEMSLPPRAVAFSPDGLYVLSGGGGGNGNAHVWHAATGGESAPFPEMHKGWLEQIEFSPDGKTVATCADDDKLILWDFSSDGQARPKSERLRHAGNGLAFSPDSALIASIGYDWIVRVRDVETQQPVTLLRSLAPASHLVFTPDSHSIVTASWGSGLRLWEARGRPDSNLLHEHRAWVHAVALSPDGQRLVSMDAQDHAIVWDVPLRRPVARLAGGGYIGGGARYSPDGRLLVTSSYSGKIKLWDPATLESRGELSNHYGVSSLSFSPDGKVLAAATGYIMAQPNTNTLFIWDMEQRQKIHRFTEAARDATAVRFSHSGNSLAVGYFDGSVRVWNWQSGVLIAEWHVFTDQVPVLAFSPDDSVLAAGTIGEEHVVLFNLTSARDYRTLEGHTGGVRSLAFAPDGRTLAVGGNGSMIRLWSMASYQPVLVLREHTGGVNGLDFSRDGTLMASCDAEGDVRVWPAPPLVRRR